MKGPPDRTKVVLRHLPASIPQSMIMEQIDHVFDGRYNWTRFRPGKNSHKHQTHSRLYINFKRGEDVIEFAEFFNGHVFVNEKGNQFKVQVEYAPSQQVPKPPKKDGREGTIVKDPEYIEFLENLSKPVDNLPSAEIQLERREAERVGAPKDAPIVTPLMDFIRQKRAAKSWQQKSASSGKMSRRPIAASAGLSNSPSTRRGSEKKKSSTVYVQRDPAKNTKGNVKSNIILVTKKDDKRLLETISAPGKSNEADSGTGSLGANEPGTKKIILLKGKGKEIEISDVPGNSPHQGFITPVRSANTSYTGTGKNNQRREGGSGRMVRTILSNSASGRSFPPSSGGSEQVMQSSLADNDKPNVQLPPKDASGFEDKLSGINDYGHGSDKFEKRTRNRDRPDRGVWAPLHRSDGSHASSESLSSTSQTAQSALESSEGVHGKPEVDSLMTKTGIRNVGSRTNSYSSYNNGTPKQFGRRTPHSAKDAEGNQYMGDGKPLKKGPPTYNSSEKRVWIQKPGSGT